MAKFKVMLSDDRFNPGFIIVDGEKVMDGPACLYILGGQGGGDVRFMAPREQVAFITQEDEEPK